MNFVPIPVNKIPEIGYFDTHSHSVSHGGEKMRKFSLQDVFDFIDFCETKGIRNISLTEHIPLPPSIYDPTPEKDCSISQNNCFFVLKEKREEIKTYAKSKKIKVLIGGEFDYFPGKINDTYYSYFDKKFQPELKVLGVHFIDTYKQKENDTNEVPFCFDFSQKEFDKAVEQKGIQNIVRMYFEIIKTAISNHSFDTIAHLELITKYNENNKYFDDLSSEYKLYIEEILNLLKTKNIALEINLSGSSFCKYCTPRNFVLQKANSLGVAITIGSDSHSGNVDIQKETDFVIKECQKIGITHFFIPEIFV